MFLFVVRIAIVALVLMAMYPARADFAAGQRAWDAGNVGEALSQWRSAADEGDRQAMLALGQRYLQGLGVIQDYVEAHKWFNLAANQGEAAALEERDALAAKMTPEQIATAQEQAAAWRPGRQSADDMPDTTEAEADTSSPASTSSLDARQPPLQAIREAQKLLAALGYRPGPADGIWGRRTGTAYWAFLRDAGLPRTETLTPQTLRAMQAAAKSKSDAAQTGSGTTAAAKTVQAPALPETREAPPASIQANALHLAAQAGDLEILKAILAAGVDVNARDSQGWTALMHAVNKGYPLLVEPLLVAGTDVDAQAPDGATALFIAARHGYSEIFSELLNKGADISIPGPKGKLPLKVAQDLKYRHIMTLPEVVALMTPEMVVVPAGSFMMGSPDDDEEASIWQMPQHRVTISKPFAVGKYEVTRGQFADFVDATGYDAGSDWLDPGFEQSDTYPVVYVSWDDAKAYIRWLSEQTGHQYRLLSEAEWEYAARAGTTTRYHFGDTISPSQANYGKNKDRTVAVGSYPANAFGLHDMHGNAREWVEDCWHENYEDAPMDGSAWVSNCADYMGGVYSRVLRGGAWLSNPLNLRSANRFMINTRNRSILNGFRVARTLKP